MIKLVHILRELVEAKAIEVPDTEMDKVDKLYDEIDRKFDELSKEAPQDSRNPLIRSEFRNYFTITPIGQKTIGVSVGLYNDPRDYAGGRGIKARDMDLKIDLSKKYILINLANFKAHSKQQFENLIRHELVHAIDPKTSQEHLYSKEAGATSKQQKKARFFKNQMEKYVQMFQTPGEFAAEASTMIGTIKKNLKKIEDEPTKEAYKKLIIKLPQDLKNKEVDIVKNDKQYKETMAWLLAGGDDVDYTRTLYTIKSWAENEEDPELFKKFLQMVAAATRG